MMEKIESEPATVDLRDVDRLESALEHLQIRLGIETSREKILAISREERPIVRFLITEDLDIWLSDKEHPDMIAANHVTGEFIRGYTGLVNGWAVVRYYQYETEKFPKIFPELLQHSNLPADLFTKFCKGAVREKLQYFLERL